MENDEIAKFYFLFWAKKKRFIFANLFFFFENLLVSENQIAQEFNVNNVTNVTFVLQTGCN